MARLRQNVSFCYIDSYPVFLDIERDLYLTLPSPLAEMFVSQTQGADPNKAAPFPEALLKTNLFDPGDAEIKPCLFAAARRVIPGTRSTFFGAATLGAYLLRERSDRRALITRLAAVEAVRARQIEPPRDSVEAIIGTIEASLMPCRRMVSSTDRCLPDAIAITHYLLRQKVPAHVVFGVRLPFAAHCWAQVGDVVVGDTPERIRAFTPIHVA